MRDLLNLNSKSKIKVGDKVRKKYTLGPLEKGYYPNWTDHIYTVDKTINNEKPVYHIKDYTGKKQNQRFYSTELQNIDKKLHRVEKVIKRRVNKGKKEIFVKWLNYPNSFNSWILEKDLVKLK